MRIKFVVWVTVLIACAYGAGYTAALDMDGWLVGFWFAVFGSAFCVGWLSEDK